MKSAVLPRSIPARRIKLEYHLTCSFNFQLIGRIEFREYHKEVNRMWETVDRTGGSFLKSVF